MATNTSAATPGHPPAVPVDADYAEAITEVAPSLLPLFVPIAAFVLLVLPLMYALRRWYATQPAGSRPTLEACVGRPSKQPAEDTPLLVGAAAHPAETAEEEELRPFWIEARDMSVCVVGVREAQVFKPFINLLSLLDLQEVPSRFKRFKDAL